MSTLGVFVDPKKVEAVMLEESEVSFRDTQFLGIGKVLQDVH